MAFRSNKDKRTAAVKYYYQYCSTRAEASECIRVAFNIPLVHGRNINRDAFALLSRPVLVASQMEALVSN